MPIRIRRPVYCHSCKAELLNIKIDHNDIRRCVKCNAILVAWVRTYIKPNLKKFRGFNNKYTGVLNNG